MADVFGSAGFNVAEGVVGESVPDVDVEALRKDLDRDLTQVMSDRRKFDDEVDLNRRLYSLDEPDQALWEGAPNKVFPIIRSKVRGISAHFMSSFNQDPLFSTRPETDEASLAAPIWESASQKHLVRTKSQIQLFMGLQEAAEVGNGPVKIVAYRRKGKWALGYKAVQIEHFYAYPVTTPDLSLASTFERTFMPMWEIERLEREGVFMQGSSKKLSSIAIEDPSDEMRRNRMTTNNMSDGHKLHEIWECYYRFEGVMYHVYYSYNDNAILNIEPSKFTEAFLNHGLSDQAPYEILKPQPRTGFVYGDSYARALLPTQNYADFAFNGRMAGGQLKIQPPVAVDGDSDAAKMLKNGIRPGEVYETVGEPDLSIKVLDLPNLDFSMEELNLATKVADMATVPDTDLGGIAPQPRVSATAVNRQSNLSDINMSRDYAFVVDQLETLQTKWWAAFDHFVVEPETLVPVFMGSKTDLLTSRQMSNDDFQNLVLTVLTKAGLLPPEFTMLLMQMPTGMAIAELLKLGVELPNFSIASTRRDDIQWIVNGNTTFVDKVLKQQLSASLVQIIQFIPIAKQYSEVYQILKQYLVDRNVKNWKTLIGDDPKNFGAPFDQLAQAQGLFNGQGSPAIQQQQAGALRA